MSGKKLMLILLIPLAASPLYMLWCCGNQHGYSDNENSNFIDTSGHTIATRIPTPAGYSRFDGGAGSFASYLQNLRLHEAGHQIHLYNGRIKTFQNNRVAVIDMEISDKDLQQCADACIRLRAEYLWKQKKFDQIHFQLTNGFDMAYNKWREGMRLKVSGNSTTWVKQKDPDSSYQTFRQYLETVFMYAGTISLKKELQTIAPAEVRPGDVIIESGSPGHAVMVADVIDGKDKSKKILLMQSYMPAQEIHIISNPDGESGNPWYKLPDGEKFATADWTFRDYKVGRFADN